MHYLFQIEDIFNEVKFSSFVETGEHVMEIDLADFIKCKFIDNMGNFTKSFLTVCIGHVEVICTDNKKISVYSIYIQKSIGSNY